MELEQGVEDEYEDLRKRRGRRLGVVKAGLAALMLQLGVGCSSPAGPSNVKPDASLEVTLQQSTAPTVATLDASGSTDSDGNISNFKYFRNGVEVASQANPVYQDTLFSEGSFDYRVEVFDDGGLSDFAERSVTVGQNNAPQYDLDIVRNGTGLTIGYSGLDPEGDTPVSWHVEITKPDGSKIVREGVNDFSETFNDLEKGLYQVTATATDSRGAVDNDEGSENIPNFEPVVTLLTNPVFDENSEHTLEFEVSDENVEDNPGLESYSDVVGPISSVEILTPSQAKLVSTPDGSGQYGVLFTFGNAETGIKTYQVDSEVLSVPDLELYIRDMLESGQPLVGGSTDVEIDGQIYSTSDGVIRVELARNQNLGLNIANANYRPEWIAVKNGNEVSLDNITQKALNSSANLTTGSADMVLNAMIIPSNYDMETGSTIIDGRAPDYSERWAQDVTVYITTTEQSTGQPVPQSMIDKITDSNPHFNRMTANKHAVRDSVQQAGDTIPYQQPGFIVVYFDDSIGEGHGEFLSSDSDKVNEIISAYSYLNTNSSWSDVMEEILGNLGFRTDPGPGGLQSVFLGPDRTLTDFAKSTADILYGFKIGTEYR